MDNATDEVFTPNDEFSNNAVHEEFDDDEDECRVCRGPAEEGRPLFAPCKCSGSIGLVHQDCLKSWLEVTRGGKCELCSVPFKFVPKYADNTPYHLPLYEVVAGILHRASAKWLPFALRAMIAIMLWICILPLATAYLYYGWMHTPSSVVSRWKWSLVATDTVAGVIIAGAIIISFLSLMSLADFLRFHWQQPNQNEVNANIVAEERVNAADREEDHDAFGADIFPYEAVNPGNNNNAAIPPHANLRGNEALRIHRNENDLMFPGLNRDVIEPNVQRNPAPLNPMEERDVNRPVQPAQNLNENDRFVPRRVPVAPINENDRFEPRFEPMEAVEDQDDGMDIHVALDELLGFRGPISGLIRNLFWLLAFNTIYLGVFTCFPHYVGRKTYSLLSNLETLAKVASLSPTISYNGVTLTFMLSSLNAESIKRNSVLQLPDLATMMLGYFFLAFSVFICRSTSALFLYMYNNNILADITTFIFRIKSEATNHENESQGLNQYPFQPNNNFQFEQREGNFDGNVNDGEMREGIASKLHTFLNGMASIAKVCVVLLLKMLFLPLFLGLWLDLATLSLFDINIHQRIVFAGGDLFGALLIHWVFGITFMLLVTVSVLQLREVVHPDLLAKVIRPQEPQPDLLGNILHENGFTHFRRMILSLAIYVALLFVFVWLPAHIIVEIGAVNFLPFFRPKLCKIFFPEFQIPLELIVFHLSMLTLLEKYKNHIGQMLHHFLLWMCEMMNMTSLILPRAVSKFELVGLCHVYIKAKVNTLEDSESSAKSGNDMTTTSEDELEDEERKIQIDPFWKHLASGNNLGDEFISMYLDQSFESSIYETGITRSNGQRVMSNQSYIRISSEKPNERNVCVPTAIGRYRFRLHFKQNQTYRRPSPGEYSPKIEVWREVVGDPLFRPPDGWDDLGVGGAEIQGRWAWENEVKSDIEKGVARRITFLESPNKVVLVCKLLLLIFSLWLAALVMICCASNIPLILGRQLFTLVHVPQSYRHDPYAFAIGAAILIPTVRSLWPMLTEEGDLGRTQKIHDWLASFRAPYSGRKIRILWMTLILWAVVIPLMLGFIFDLCIVTERDWWLFSKKPFLVDEIPDIWLIGVILSHSWALLCYHGVCTKEFWLRFRFMFEANENRGNRAGAVNNNNNDIVNNNNNDDDDEVIFDEHNEGLQWQGRNGKIGVFVRVIINIFSNWEWDKVDREILLDEVLVPITMQLLLTITAPLMITWTFAQLQLYCHNVELGGLLLQLGPDTERDGLMNMILFLFVFFTIVIVQVGKSFKSPLKNWYKVAERTARDDRYLVGETLLNYQHS